MLNDSLEDWTPITVHLTGRISPRKRTRPYKGPMFAAYPGDIVFSKIDARSGAIGVLPSDIAKAVVTSEYPVFATDLARLEAAFVKLVLRTGGFIDALRNEASGTSGRKRVTADAFEDLRIPVPAPHEQRAMVAAHEAAMDRAEALEREADAAESEAIAAFEAALGLEAPAPSTGRAVFVASFRDLDRWSHEAILRRADDPGTRGASRYPIVQLRDVIADLENGWSPRCHDRVAGPDEWGVLKLGAVSFGVFDDTENKALPERLEPRPRLEVTSGQLLISRANITRLVGATALIGSVRRRLMLCDKLFRVIPREPARAEVMFLVEVLRISSVRRQIEANVTGTSPTMKNIAKSALMALSFPLPPEQDRVEMVAVLASARAKAAVSRERATKVRAVAWAAFEAAVYSPRGASGEA